MDGTSYLIASSVLLVVAIGVALALKTLWSLERVPDFTLLSESPQEKYAAMGRLLSTADIQFLRGQKGYSKQIETTFRRRRADVFRLYLESMRKDFAVIHASARLMAAHGVGGTELSGQLVHLPMTFRRTVFVARWQVLLYERGWATPAFSIQPAIDALENLRAHIDLSAATQAV